MKKTTISQLITFAAIAGLLLVPVSASAATISGREDAVTPSDVAAPSVAATESCEPATSFRRNNFSNRNTINSQYLPLVPGTQFTLKGSANRGDGVVPHREVFTVTDLTKVIDGVRTIIVWDTDTNEGQLVESELAFFAQDNLGNVWNLGEYPEEYENGKFIGAPDTWIVGEEGAKAGIHMLANPIVGTPSYLQGKSPRIDFLDCAKVLKTGQTICVPAGCYSDVLVTDEWSPLDRKGGHQRKYYAPGVGNIRVGAVRDPEAENLELTDVTQLSPGALAHVRNKALKLDKRAHQVSKVYAHTLPARRTHS
jgi:hypothetical protein